MVVKHFPPRGKTMVKHFGVKSGNIPKYPVKHKHPSKPLNIPLNKENGRISIPPPSHFLVIPLGFDGRCGVWPIYGGVLAQFLNIEFWESVKVNDRLWTIFDGYYPCHYIYLVLIRYVTA